MGEFSPRLRLELAGWIEALQEFTHQAVASLPARVSTSLSLLTKQAQTGMHMFGAHTQETLRTVLSEEMYARLVKLGLGSTSLALVGAAAVMVTILLIRIVVKTVLRHLSPPATANSGVTSTNGNMQKDTVAVASNPDSTDGNVSNRPTPTLLCAGASRPALPSTVSVIDVSTASVPPQRQELQLQERGAALPENGHVEFSSSGEPLSVEATSVSGTCGKGALGAENVDMNGPNSPLVAEGASGWGMKLLSASANQNLTSSPPGSSASSSAAHAQPVRIRDDGHRAAWSESGSTKASANPRGGHASGVVEGDVPVGSASHRLGSCSVSALQKIQTPPQAVSDLTVGSAGKPDESNSSINGVDVTASTVLDKDEISPHRYMEGIGYADNDDMPVSWLCCGVGGVSRRRQLERSQPNSRGSSTEASPSDRDNRRASQRKAAFKQGTEGVVSMSQFQAESTPAPPDDTSVPKPTHANHVKPQTGSQPHSPAGALEPGLVRTIVARNVSERSQSAEGSPTMSASFPQASAQARAKSGSPSFSASSGQHAGVNGFSVIRAAGRISDSPTNGSSGSKRFLGETTNGATGIRSCTNSPPRSPSHQQQRRRPSYDSATLDRHASSSAYGTWSPGAASHPGFMRRLSDRIRLRLSHDGGEQSGHNPPTHHGAGGGRQRRRTEDLVSMVENPSAAVMGSAQRPEGGVCLRHDIHPDDTSSPVANSWSGLVLGDSFQVRGREYLSDKKKTASEESMYEVVQVEAYRTDRRMLNVAKLLEITSETVCGLPTAYVLNIAIPDYVPPWRKPPEGCDGPGICVLVHAKMTKETREALQAGSTKPEYLLLRRFLEGDDNTAVVDDDSELVDKFPHENKYRRQTKMLAVVRGGADQLPYLVRLALNKGNGKPFLVNRCGIAFPRAQPGVFEFCVDVHNFQQLAVTGLNKCKDYFLKLLVDMCVLLEGQESSELPERVLMCVRLCYPDFKNVKCHIDDVTSSDSTACNE